VASDSGLCLFRTDNKDECRLLEPKPEGTSIVTILFSPDSRAFVAITRNGEGDRAWSVETGQPIADLSALKPVTNVPDNEKSFPQAVSPRGQHILYRSAGKIEIVRTSDGVSTPLSVDGFVYSAAFSPDGEHLALGVEKGGLQLWRIGGEQPEQIFQGHEHEVQSIVFDSTGELLLSGAEGGDAKLWRLDERDYLQRFELTEDDVVSVAIEADNRHVLLMSNDGVSRWAVSPIVVANKDEQLRLACERLETRGVDGFTPRDRLDYPFLKGVSDNPCVSLGLTKAKPPAPEKPASTAPAVRAAPR
jgi:WD40 repeat protein